MLRSAELSMWRLCRGRDEGGHATASSSDTDDTGREG